MSRFLMCARLNLCRGEQRLSTLQHQQAVSAACVNNNLLLCPQKFKINRPFSNRSNDLRQQQKSALTEADNSSHVPSTSVKERVKETTTTAWYSSVILAGVGVTAFILYYIMNELFSKDSANNVYAAALKRCLSESRIVDLLGDPILGFGEETRRGRRRHVSHLLYEKDGVNFMRMKFYLKGSRKQATVHLEMKQNPQTGHYDYRYLFVQVDDISRHVVILEDNRTAMEDTNLPTIMPAFGIETPSPTPSKLTI